MVGGAEKLFSEGSGGSSDACNLCGSTQLNSLLFIKNFTSALDLGGSLHGGFNCLPGMETPSRHQLVSRRDLSVQMQY